MIKLLTFLYTTFKNKEGVTRATGTMVATLAIVYQFFVPRIEYDTLKKEYDTLSANTISMQEYTSFKSQTDRQQRLLWSQIAQMKNTLQKSHIYVPEIVDVYFYAPAAVGESTPTQ